MEDKAYIIIDDNDQRQRMEQRIDSILRPDGYKIKSFYFNPNDREFWNEDKEMDVAKFISKIVEQTKTYHINVIACDYQFSGNQNNGIDIIDELRNAEFLVPIILYSGNESKVASGLLNADLGNEEKIQRFIKILKCKIERFVSRDTYYEMVVEILKKSYNLKEIVLKKMGEYSETVIRFDSGFFEGKPFSEAVREIKRDSLQGNKFMSELLELSIAHFAQMNKNE